jgi:MarR family transcriptional regulator for hemolysin
MELPTYASGLLFTKAHRAVRARIYDVLEKYDLNPSYWSILGTTMQAPEGIRLASVASVLAIKAPMVTVMADDLIDKGLIKRIPHHTDGRAKLLVITPKGKKLAEVIELDLNLEIRNLLAGLTDPEVAAFRRALQTIIENDSKPRK